VTTDRDREIASAIASGSTAPAVAAEYGITPARVRQIAKAAGVEPRRAGRPVSTGRGEARVQVRLSAAERDALATAAGSVAAIPAYLRARGLASPARLAIDALTTARRGSVTPHTTPVTEVPAVRCQLVGADHHEDGRATLHLDVGGTAQEPAWRVVIEVGP
jgi:hypothetical protein